MDTPNLASDKLAATVAESRDIGLETPPAKEEKGRFTKMLRNGSESKTERRAKVGKARAKGKERKAVTAIVMLNPYATIGARGMGTADMEQRATSLTMDLKEVEKEKEKTGQHHYRPRP